MYEIVNDKHLIPLDQERAVESRGNEEVKPAFPELPTHQYGIEYPCGSAF
jgi:hypothetical protein